jgi:hypothetical protein
MCGSNGPLGALRHEFSGKSKDKKSPQIEFEENRTEVLRRSCQTPAQTRGCRVRHGGPSGSFLIIIFHPRFRNFMRFFERTPRFHMQRSMLNTMVPLVWYNDKKKKWGAVFRLLSFMVKPAYTAFFFVATTVVQ